MIEADVSFHNAIYAASGNPLIAESARRHWHTIRRAMGAVLQAVGARASVWDEHEAIVKAIARGDEARAERLMREHGDTAGTLLSGRIASALTPHSELFSQAKKVHA
jgi:DNA-binding FadR family transcriptional regulator